MKHDDHAVAQFFIHHAVQMDIRRDGIIVNVHDT